MSKELDITRNAQAYLRKNQIDISWVKEITIPL